MKTKKRPQKKKKNKRPHLIRCFPYWVFCCWTQNDCILNVWWQEEETQKLSKTEKGRLFLVFLNKWWQEEETRSWRETCSDPEHLMTTKRDPKTEQYEKRAVISRFPEQVMTRRRDQILKRDLFRFWTTDDNKKRPENWAIRKKGGYWGSIYTWTKQRAANPCLVHGMARKHAFQWLPKNKGTQKCFPIFESLCF